MSLLADRRRLGARKRLSGAVVPLVACCMVLLCAVMALAVDVSGAYRLRARNEQTLELAKDAVMANLNSLKFSEDPAAAAEEVVAEALSQDGFSGKATFYYYELPESETGATDRVAGMCLTLESSQPSRFARVLGQDTQTVSSELAWSTNPYSDTDVWRPARVTNRRYEVELPGEGAPSAATLTGTDGLPAALKDELASAKADVGK